MTQDPRDTPPPSAPAGPAPYAGLHPDLILDALSAIGVEGDGRLLQLNSFENRVFQVMLTDGRAVVAKFYRPGRWSDAQILEEHAFSREAAEAEIPVVAPIELPTEPAPGSGVERLGEGLARIARDGQVWRFAVWPRRAGRAPELEDPEVLMRLGHALARLHDVGARRPFAHRHTMDIRGDAQRARDRIDATDRVPPDQSHAWAQASARALACIDELLAQTPPTPAIRLHGDCHPGNLLWRDDQPNLVDLDDACNGPAVQDLWMLLSGDVEAARWQAAQVLDGYRQLRPFDERQLALVPALRLLRLLRHNAWVADRWDDPAFPVAYPDFGSSGYWAQQAMQLRELAADADDQAASSLFTR